MTPRGLPEPHYVIMIIDSEPLPFGSLYWYALAPMRDAMASKKDPSSPLILDSEDDADKSIIISRSSSNLIWDCNAGDIFTDQIRQWAESYWACITMMNIEYD